MSRVIPPWERVAPPAMGPSVGPTPSYAQQPPQYAPQQPPFQQPFPQATPQLHQQPQQFQQQSVPYSYPQNSGYPAGGWPPQPQQPVSGGQFLQEMGAGSASAGWMGASTQSLALGAAALMVGQQLQQVASGDSSVSSFPKIPSGVFDGSSGSGSGGWWGWSLGGLRGYLNVSHRYVGERLVQLLFPFAASRFGSQTPSYNEFGSSEGALRLTAEPWKAADLYMPVMALVTYVILYAASRGGEDFNPDILYDTAAFAVLLVGVEVGIARAVSYLLGLPSLVFWESAGVAGYKFVHLSVVLFFRLVLFRTSSVMYWTLFAYVAGAAAVATFNFLRQPLKALAGGSGAHHLPAIANYVLLAVAGFQLPLLWLLQRAL